MGSDRVTDDTEANTIVRLLYLFITIVIIKEGRTKKWYICVEKSSNFQCLAIFFVKILKCLPRKLPKL
jgi:hypothetical protein